MTTTETTRIDPGNNAMTLADKQEKIRRLYTEITIEETRLKSLIDQVTEIEQTLGVTKKSE